MTFVCHTILCMIVVFRALDAGHVPVQSTLVKKTALVDGEESQRQSVAFTKQLFLLTNFQDVGEACHSFPRFSN